MPLAHVIRSGEVLVDDSTYTAVDLHFTDGSRQWVVTAYALAFGVLLSPLALAQVAGPAEPIVMRSGKPLDLLLTQAELRALVEERPLV